MSKKTEIEVRYGVPTKESIQGLIKEFELMTKKDIGYIYFSSNYGIKPSLGATNLISWNEHTQEYIHWFIRFAKSRGIRFGVINDYTVNLNGNTYITQYVKPIIDQYFDKSQEVRASHLLYQDALKSDEFKGVSKLSFYLTIQTEKGMPRHKDPNNGCFGYKLKFVGYKPNS